VTAPGEAEPASLPLSVNLMPTGPIEQVVELARLAEERGFERCWVYDEGLVTRDVYVTLAAVATATDRILIGPGITNPYVRHPGATAVAVASLDELSGGRAFLGLGAGGGLTLDPLALTRRRPLAAVEQMVGVLRSLWAGDTVSARGPVFDFDRARLDFGRPDIEIILAGRGPRMIDLGGRVADGFYLSYVHKSLLPPTIARLRAAQPGRARPFRIVYSTMVATTDDEREAARAQLSFRLVDSPPAVRRLVGVSDAHVDRLRDALAEGGPSVAARHVDPDWVDQFVIAGTRTEASKELRTLLADGGIDEFQVPVTDLDRGAGLIDSTVDLLAG